jgi:hypothetical protein
VHAAAGIEMTPSKRAHGDIKLAFVVTKGQFELDVICAKELLSTLNDEKKPGQKPLLVYFIELGY